MSISRDLHGTVTAGLWHSFVLQTLPISADSSLAKCIARVNYVDFTWKKSLQSTIIKLWSSTSRRTGRDYEANKNTLAIAHTVWIASVDPEKHPKLYNTKLDKVKYIFLFEFR